MTAMYQRGRELHELEVGPILPAHLDEHCKRCTFASLAFEEVHGREPETGEVLRFSDVQAIHNPEVYGAWYQDFAGASWTCESPLAGWWGTDSDVAGGDVTLRVGLGTGAGTPGFLLQ